jgi:hypothetical protein
MSKRIQTGLNGEQCPAAAPSKLKNSKSGGKMTVVPSSNFPRGRTEEDTGRGVLLLFLFEYACTWLDPTGMCTGWWRTEHQGKASLEKVVPGQAAQLQLVAYSTALFYTVQLNSTKQNDFLCFSGG